MYLRLNISVSKGGGQIIPERWRTYGTSPSDLNGFVSNETPLAPCQGLNLLTELKKKKI